MVDLVSWPRLAEVGCGVGRSAVTTVSVGKWPGIPRDGSGSGRQTVIHQRPASVSEPRPHLHLCGVVMAG